MWRALRAAATRWSGAEVLFAAVPSASARREAEAEGGCEWPSGPGGAARPFPDADVILEQIAERIAAEVEARPPACLWCLARLNNGAAFCSPTCQGRFPPRPRPGKTPLKPPQATTKLCRVRIEYYPPATQSSKRILPMQAL
jgi:hypothetical protein